jgi:hypothetical protein
VRVSEVGVSHATIVFVISAAAAVTVNTVCEMLERPHPKGVPGGNHSLRAGQTVIEWTEDGRRISVTVEEHGDSGAVKITSTGEHHNSLTLRTPKCCLFLCICVGRHLCRQAQDKYRLKHMGRSCSAWCMLCRH